MTNKIGFVYGKEAKQRKRKTFVRKYKQVIYGLIFSLIIVLFFLFLTKQIFYKYMFDKIRNLNDQKMIEKFADIVCEKDGIRYIISVKARNNFK